MFSALVTPPSSPQTTACSDQVISAATITEPTAESLLPCSIPNELLCHTFDAMPSKQLIGLRAVSPHFANVINYILRCRFLAIAEGGQYDILFESCAPSETRYTHHRLAKLSHFEPSVNLAGGDAAFFALPDRMPGFLALDDMEEFGTSLLALQVRTKLPSLPSPPATPDPSPSSSPTSPPGRSFRPGATGRSAHPFAIPLHQLQYSINIGSGHVRLFRHQFEDVRPSSARLASGHSRTSSAGALPISRPREIHPTTTTTTRATVPHVLVPDGNTALLSAQIVCFREPASARDHPFTSSASPRPGVDFGSHVRPQPWNITSSASSSPAATTLFEYYFERVKVDVSKFVVAVEESCKESNSLQFFIPTRRTTTAQVMARD